MFDEVQFAFQFSLLYPNSMKAKVKAVVIDEKRYWTILALILVFGFGLKLVRLSFPENLYFDEVYHGYTAGLYIEGNPDAYNIYVKNPPGKAAEWTHPPTAKLLMAASMLVFGNNSFGWRFSSTVFGTLLILFTALLAWELFESRLLSLLAAFLASIENLLFTQARIAMNDSHLVAFILLCFYFYIRWRKDPENTKFLLISGLGLGLALSTKWSALFVYFVILIERLTSWWKSPNLIPSFKEIKWLAISFIILPVAIYMLSYSHFFWFGYSWDEFVRLQRNMWWYHTNLTASHPYQSKPWQWLLNLKPVWMYVDYSRNDQGYIANIYNTGNSVILYLGLICVGWAVRDLQKKKWSWQLWFCVIAYFMFWVPWLRSPRIMLFYHYMPAIPILCILTALRLEKMWLEGGKKPVIAILVLATAWFALFYPHNTALHMPKAFVESVYHFIPSWK
jgi:dolichyl-phosphate-mannose-protein mannosyltransferase